MKYKSSKTNPNHQDFDPRANLPKGTKPRLIPHHPNLDEALEAARGLDINAKFQRGHHGHRPSRQDYNFAVDKNLLAGTRY